MSLYTKMKATRLLDTPRRGVCLWVISIVALATVIYRLSSSSLESTSSSTVQWKDFPALARSRLPQHQMTSRSPTRNDPDCHAGALCAGPGRTYGGIGRQVGAVIRGEFVVPPLPESFSSTNQTYYDYVNIFWQQNIHPGYMNQFVPQLMLGSALANSSGPPEYRPTWLRLSSWHIGAQYFMAICEDSKDNGSFDKNCDRWVPKAATGELVAVEPGEGVFTTFELVDARDRSSVEWHLTMGVIGDDSRVSRLVVPKPFMGLVNGTSSWKEEIYDNVYVGSCLENYGMFDPSNYPSFWRINIDIQAANGASVQPMWQDWKMDHNRDCEWQPRSSVRSSTSNQEGTQIVSWKAWLHKDDQQTPVLDMINM